MERRLTAVMYHYVRDFPRTPFPRIKGLSLDGFRRQIGALIERFEIATLESAVAFLAGSYCPRRDLCLLTFDDGLKEHASTVTPILAERRLQGLFFAPTAGLEDARVLAVHKNHFLMAAIDFAEYRNAVLGQIQLLSPETATQVEPAIVAATYRWDPPDVGAFKYLLNFGLSEALRERILDGLFPTYLGDERAFARELYVSWDEARTMQDAGMVIGGHSHGHSALATLDDEQRRQDLATCTGLLHRRLKPQPLWPFSYPYGKRQSYSAATADLVRELGYCCAFATDVGVNQTGCDLFALRRVDTKDVAQVGDATTA
jgi:peptidoglycan/xylan/chitin deacetylase (PgdA/CDA1 family)